MRRGMGRGMGRGMAYTSNKRTLNFDWSRSYTFFHISSLGSSNMPTLHKYTPFWSASSSSDAGGKSSSSTDSTHLGAKLNTYGMHVGN